jgi:hypothetical protein
MIGMSQVFARRKAIPALLKSTLDRFYRSANLATDERHALPRNQLTMEALEPRVLLSADFIPVAPLGSLVPGERKRRTDGRQLDRVLYAGARCGAKHFGCLLAGRYRPARNDHAP